MTNPENLDYKYQMNKNKPDEDMMFAMSNLLPKSTGLKYPIWYSAGMENLDPGIKIDLEDDKSICVSILDKKATGDVDSISSEDLNDIFRWIALNMEILLKYWNGARKGIIDSCDVAEKIVKLQ